MDPSTPPKLPPTSPMHKPDSKSPNITLCESPHRSHGLNQGDPFPNSKNNSRPSLLETTHPIRPNSKIKSHPSLDETNHSEQDHPKTPTLPLTYPMSKYDTKPPNITLCKSPHGSHVPKQGNPAQTPKPSLSPFIII